MGLAIMGAASFKRRGSNWSAPTDLFIHLELRRAERTSCCCISLKEKEVVGSVPSDLASTLKLSSTPSGTSGKLERSNKVPHWIKLYIYCIYINIHTHTHIHTYICLYSLPINIYIV